MSHLNRGAGRDKESRFADLFSRLGKEKGREVRRLVSAKAAGCGVGAPVILIHQLETFPLRRVQRKNLISSRLER